MKTCPNCKVTVTSEQRRCGNCGYALTPTHVSFKKTEPIISPPPTYIPPPSPHPAARSRWSPTSIKIPRRPAMLVAGVLLLALVLYIVYMLTRPPQLAGQWYGALSSRQNGSNLVYAEAYLDLQVGVDGTISGSGEYCALSGNTAVKPGQRSPISITGHLSGAEVTVALNANQYGGAPGVTSFAGSLSGQQLTLQLQPGSATSSIGLLLQPGSRSDYEASCGG